MPCVRYPAELAYLRLLPDRKRGLGTETTKQMKKLLTFLVLAILGAGLLAAPPASATTVLFAGGEDIDFTFAGNTSVSTTASGYNSGYAREFITMNSPGAGTPTNNALSPTFTAGSTLWIYARLAESSGSYLNAQLIEVFSPDGVARILVRGASGGLYKISTENASGTITDLVTMSSVCFGSTLTGFDLYINYGTSGEVTLYCNGVSVADYVGNVTTNSATQLNRVALGSTGLVGYGGSNWSEIIVATTDTRSMRLVTLAPAANGNADTFDTGGVSSVNETTLNQATVNASGTSGEIQEYTVGSLPTGTFSVVDLWTNAQAQVDTTGPQHLQAMVRTGSTDYTSSNLSPPQSSWGWIGTDWPTNPYTGVAWTTSDLSAAGFNIGFKSAN